MLLGMWYFSQFPYFTNLKIFSVMEDIFGLILVSDSDE